MRKLERNLDSERSAERLKNAGNAGVYKNVCYLCILRDFLTHVGSRSSSDLRAPGVRGVVCVTK